MPRQARLDVPGALHHIIVRGNNRSDKGRLRGHDKMMNEIKKELKGRR
jgi:hypothetical protein